jgi:hypothetical protein
MSIAQTIVFMLQVYGGIGLAVAAAFLLFGIDRIDPAARGTYSFRPVLIPGTVVLWPLVLARWWALETGKPGGSH